MKINRVFAKVPSEHRARFSERRLQTNIGRMYAFSIYVIVLQIVLNVINLIKTYSSHNPAPTNPDEVDIKYYVIVSLIALTIGIVYFVLFTLVKKEKITSYKVQRILVESVLYAYIIIQLIFCTFKILSDGGINSYIIAILIIGLVPIIPPMQSLLTILGSFIYIIIVMYFTLTRNILEVWDSIMLADIWTNFVIITILTAYISVFIYRMYVENFLQAVNLEDTNRELDVKANTDQMTGIPNRRSLSRSCSDIWQAALARRGQLAVAVVDIDFFKVYNDKFGHLKGDQCLMQVAKSLQGSFRRNSDIVGRYGGEEFLIIYETENKYAFSLAEKARMQVEEMHIEHATGEVSPHITVSVGVCLISPIPGMSVETAIKAADDALYEAKLSGRNKTILREFSSGDKPLNSSSIHMHSRRLSDGQNITEDV